jgi:hypothetical protein
MLLKDLPDGFSLQSSVEVLGLMLQSILIRAEERLEGHPLSASEARAFETLLALLEAAQRDAVMLKERRVQ